MQHKSFLTREVDPEALIALARALDPGMSLARTSDFSPLDHIARIGALGASGLGYYDGPADALAYSGAGAVISHAECTDGLGAALTIISRHPRTLFIRMMEVLLADNPIDYRRTTAKIEAQVSPGESQIEPGAIVMPGTRIGANCVIETGAILRPGVILEDGVHVKTGAILGSSGAAIAVTDSQTVSQPHLGTLIVGAGTEIGSQSNLVRGIFGATVLGKRCVIGNQVNIGHNCSLGHGVWVGARAVVGGYTTVGHFTNIGMGSLCKNGLKIGADCNIAMGSCLMQDLPDGKSCIGNPARQTGFRFHAGPAVSFPVPPEIA